VKIIGFDCWTQGARHYARLREPLAARGIELLLIHLGSWGDELGRPNEEIIAGLRVRDIAWYGRRSLAEVLQLEQPDAVIFTSLDAFAHRAFNRYCRERGVPALHLFHGLQHLMEVSYRSSPLKRIWLMRRHIPKLLLRFLPAYIRSLRDTRATRDEWLQLLHDLAGRARNVRGELAAGDSVADGACVYVPADVPVAVERYHHRPDAVTVVGNPDLASFGLGESGIASCLRDTRSSAEVMYIDTALRAYGWVYDSNEDFVRHILGTRDALAHQGKRLLFKPHPAQVTGIVESIGAAGVEIVSSPGFVPRLQVCCACITEPSSAALIPALLGMPLLLAKYGKLRGQRFGEMFQGYPRSRDFAEPAAFSLMLDEEFVSLDVAAVQAWIRVNTGPMPASAMPERVADSLVALIRAPVARRGTV
jgi:hypothetical protein